VTEASPLTLSNSGASTVAETAAATAAAVSGAGLGKVGPAALPDDLCSKDAYMLIYTRCGCNYGSCVPTKGSEGELPEHVRKAVRAMAVEQAALARQQEERRIALRVRIYSVIVLVSHSMAGCPAMKRHAEPGAACAAPPVPCSLFPLAEQVRGAGGRGAALGNVPPLPVPDTWQMPTEAGRRAEADHTVDRRADARSGRHDRLPLH
jgi:hypothetical protein